MKLKLQQFMDMIINEKKLLDDYIMLEADDQHIIEMFQLDKDKTYTPLELCMTLYYQLDKNKDVLPSSFKKVAMKYIQTHAPIVEENLSFRLGIIDAFCEVVAAGVKRLAFSHATNDEKLFYHDLIHAYHISSKYGVHFYIEHHLIETLLFKNSGGSVLIFYQDENDIQAYHRLKNKENDTFDKQIAIAKELGHLLSYQDSKIEMMIQKTLKKSR